MQGNRLGATVMKNEYITPNMEVLRFHEADVITSSNELEPMPIDIF